MSDYFATGGVNAEDFEARELAEDALLNAAAALGVANGKLSWWSGTQAQFDALGTRPETTLHLIVT